MISHRLHPLRAVHRSWSWTSPKHLARRHRYWRLDGSRRDTPGIALTMGPWSSVHHPFSIWQCVKTNSTPLVHIKIAGKWMFIPLKMVLIGIDTVLIHTHIFPMNKCELGTQLMKKRPKRSFPPILPATHVEISRTSTFALKHQNERGGRFGSLILDTQILIRLYPHWL